MKRRLFAFVWRRRLNDRFYGKPFRVVRVKSWRTAIVDGYCGNRATVTFMIRIGRWYL